MEPSKRTQPSTSSTREGDPYYTTHLVAGLNQLRLEGTLCDVTIIVANQRFPAHKAVLSANSTYFKSMFASGFQEKDSSEVTIQGEAGIFVQLLEFAYTGYFHLSVANAWSVLKMASYMNFNQAVTVCKKYMLQHVDGISKEDTYDIISLGEIQDDLSDMVQRFRIRLLHDFPCFFETESILELASKDFVMSCLEDENIETDLTTEEQILEGVLNWLKHDWDQRKIHTVTLLQKVRLGLVPAEKLTELFTNEILAFPECTELKDQVTSLRANRSITDLPLNQSHPDLFATRNTITALLMLFQRSTGKAAYFDDTGNEKPKWKTLHKFQTLEGRSEMRFGSTPIVASGQLYVAGHSSFIRYNTKTNKWDELASISRELVPCCMVELDGYIYCLSREMHRRPLGHSGPESDNSRVMSRYNTATNEWQRVSPYVIEGAFCDTTDPVTYKGKILVTSIQSVPCVEKDNNEPDFFVVIQSYNPANDTWHVVWRKRHVAGSPFLTVHRSSCYLVFEMDREFKVYKLRCDVDSDPPTVCLGEEIVQTAEGTTQSFAVFSINNSIFVNLPGCVYQLTQESRDCRSLRAGISLRAGMSSNLHPLVYFTFDKRS